MFEKYPDVVSVPELCNMLGGISRKLAYRLLADGHIYSVKVGRYLTGKPLSDQNKSA